jgi:RNA 2',3'-cyclic 3'-phosphodiesterase
MPRLFLAIPVPAEYPAYREQLKEANKDIEGIKWMRLHNLHLTVYFIGNVADEAAGSIPSIVNPLLTGREPFTIQFESIAFAPSRDPRMVWARFCKHPAFTDLANDLHGALQVIVTGSDHHYNDPYPHVTLARFHNKIHRSSKIVLPQVELPSLPIDAIELWESVPSPEGVRYQPVERFLFAKTVE